MASLTDQFCPNVHDAPVTAAVYDPWSGVLATGDSSGVVAVQRQGENAPGLLFQPGVGITGALGLIRGGTMIAVGDDDGTIGVYSTADGSPLFQEIREGARGRVRAMRGVAVSPEGARVATIALDGLLRIWDIEKGTREVAWQGFGGLTVEFDERGQRVLCLDDAGQPRLVDLLSHQGLPMDKLQMPAERAVFSLDGTLVVTAGQAGISLLRVVDGHMIHSFATRGGSGIMNVVQRPDGAQIGAISSRSIHIFSMPDLQPVGSQRHGAPDATGAAWWGQQGIKVGGSDGLAHGGDAGNAGPVTGVGGFGEHRLAIHGERVAVWTKNKRVREIVTPGPLKEAQVDRDGRYVLTIPQRGSVAVYETRTGERVLDGGPETVGATTAAIGGTVVAVALASGGVRWWDMARGKALELRWPEGMTLSHGGTWLGVITPRGAIKILDPANGREAVDDPIPTADVPARLLSFVNRRPDLLVVDAEHILAHYDLGASARDKRPAEGRDVIQLHAPPDRVWGITGGQFAALRVPEGDTCTLLFIDLQRQSVVSEVNKLHRDVQVDAENGFILEPARSGALLEREMNGAERRVLRALPDNHWICFSKRGVLDASDGAAEGLG